MRAREFIIAFASASLLLVHAITSPQHEAGNYSILELRQAGTKGSKYFFEAAGYDHYDRDHFHGDLVYEEKRAAGKLLIRAYLETFKRLGLETWLAHGTLLGWWFNGKMLPWDDDGDTQVSISTLKYMAEHLNRTTHRYKFADPPLELEYLLDVNPNWDERRRGNGQNNIDARWIDVRNGMFIDITSLAELEPETYPGIWFCKNRNPFHTKDLFPMRRTVFEGVTASIPHAYESILRNKYGQGALDQTSYQGHSWDPETKEFVLDRKKARKRRQRSPLRTT